MKPTQLGATVCRNSGKGRRYRLNYCCKNFWIIVATEMREVNFFGRLDLRRSYLLCLLNLRRFVACEDVHAFSLIIKKVIIA